MNSQKIIERYSSRLLPGLLYIWYGGIIFLIGFIVNLILSSNTLWHVCGLTPMFTGKTLKSNTVRKEYVIPMSMIDRFNFGISYVGAPLAKILFRELNHNIQ